MQNKQLKTPVTVTEEERRKHEETCVPFRSWCPYCVTGQKQDDPHFRKSQEEKDDPKVVPEVPSPSLWLWLL